MTRVLVTEALDPIGIAMLREAGFEVDARDSTSEEALLEIVDRYDALLIKTYTRVSAAVIDRASRLKVVARAGTGLDKVDVDYARSKGILVQNTPEANIVSVAELVFAFMLAVARKLVPADRYVRSRAGWDRDQFTGVELAGRCLAIVGFGNIGKLVAKRAQAFDMTCLGYDPYVEAAAMAQHGVEKVENLDSLLDRADCITIHVPLVASTHHLFSDEQFARMKEDAILINTARGPVVDQQALIRALQEGQIGGAGLDVFESEPPDSEALLALDNLVVSPHVGAATVEALRKMTSQGAQVIIDHLKS